jgi:formylglycine-generating enzyme required for sulfatase activity
VIHRDIKPANIIRRRADGVLILVDFGAAKQATQTMLAKTGTMIGSPEFAAPEQTRGKPAFASDIYSLGVTCIHLLTNVPPFDLFDIGEDNWVWRDYLVNNPVDDLLGKVLDGSIVNALARRYRSATEAFAALGTQNKPSIATKSTSQPQSNKLPTEPNLESFSFNRAQIRIVEGFSGKAKEIIIDKFTSQAKRFIEDLGNGVKVEMIAIPGGEFLMGSPVTEKDSRNNERPQHRVKVPSFYMGRYPVTQSQYEILAGKNPSSFKGGNLPVENVSWDDAQYFCQRLTAKSSRKYSLPSESQWEYACRAGTITPFHYGETISTDLANYNGNYTYENGIKGRYLEKTSAVGSSGLANSFGLSDMHGNIWEWCEDIWHDSYKGAPNDGSAWVSGDDQRLLRGGSWDYMPNLCRSAYRFRWSANYSNSFLIGFRLICI